jgi:RHS repeat-associated protein
MEGNWNGAQGNNQYQYNEKEWNDDFGLGWNDYGARFYDPAMSRWVAVDPLREKYLRWSPYHFSGNNPVKFVDYNGKEWKRPEDQKKADDMNKKAQRQIESNNKKVERLSRQLEKLNASIDKATGEKLEKLEAKADKISKEIGNTRHESDLLNAFQVGLKDMGESKSMSFSFNETNKSVNFVERGMDTKKEDGSNMQNIIINYREGSIGNIFHETTHGIQQLRGEIRLEEGSQLAKGGDIGDEVVAYRIQFAIDSYSVPNSPESINHITPSFVREIRDDNGKKMYDHLPNYSKY